MVSGNTAMKVLRLGLACAVVLLPGWPVAAAQADAAALARPPPAPAEPIDELDEIVVTGARRVRNPQKIVDWLKRLVGQFSYDGYVDLSSEGAPQGRRAVKGAGDCTGFGPGPGVQCVMKAIWPEARGSNGEEIPGGISTLAPAMVLYGLDPDYMGIRYLQLDNRGIAEGGLGELDGETLTSKAPCATLPAPCQRITRINAHPDGKLIQMQIDIQREDQRLVRFMFVMHRVGPVPGAEPAATPRPGAPR